jgi:hypothetical protein
MKKLFSFIFIALLFYTIYYDLRVGTLPNSIVNEAHVKAQEKPKIAYFKTKIKPGETLLSIVEKQLKKPLPVSISDIINDFELLNPGQKPEEIQIGKTYKFPDYSRE